MGAALAAPRVRGLCTRWFFVVGLASPFLMHRFEGIATGGLIANRTGSALLARLETTE